MLLAESLLGSSSTAATYIEDVFSTYLYTGNGSSTTGQTITNNVDLSTKGGLVWIKCRDGANDHVLFDTARGAGTTASNNQALSSNLTSAEDIGSSIDYLSSFNADGFTVKRGGTYAPTLTANTSGTLYTSWTFRKQAKFFDVVTFTSSAAGVSTTINHSLGSSPGCVIVKALGGANENWWTWHRSLSSTQYLALNTTAAVATGTPTITVSSTQVVFGANWLGNASTSYVAYLFAHDAGGFGASGSDNVISCGSFTSNSGDVATITLGYEPQFVLMKSTSTTGQWWISDNMRGFTVSGEQYLLANSSAAEASGTNIRLTNTGFTQNSTTGAATTYIYIAIRRGPMKTPTSGTSVYNAISRNGTGAVANIIGVGFSPDLIIPTFRGSPYTNYGKSPADRLRGPLRFLKTNAVDAETASTNSITSINMDGWTVGADSNAAAANAFTQPAINWAFKRAPGFFDQVCYTGTGAALTVSHNLGVAPELMIVKNRSTTTNWFVYSAATGAGNYLNLNGTAASTAGSTAWNNTAPTASVFTVGTSGSTNGNTENHVAYLFATVAGVSKVGSYTGTGTTLQIDCGFTGGARFVLIKRTDSTGDWYVWDSARGIVAGNDPYLLLNSTAAEVTSTDYIDTYSAGFEISSTAPAAINASGGTFIFLAIA